MGKYKNQEYLKKEIMEQSRHLFIYGYDTEYKSKFLQDLEKEYSFSIGSSSPFALYVDSFGLPRTDEIRDKYIIHKMSREYLSLTIALKILDSSKEIDEGILNERLSRLVYLINRIRNLGHAEIKTVVDLYNEIKASRDFYYENYVRYINGLIDSIPIDDVSILFLPLGMFVSTYKHAMDMNSYFGIIFDNKNKFAISSIQEVNNLINGRINSDMSVKVATDPDGWQTYRDTNGQFVEAVHDYGIVELDDSYKEYTRKLNKGLKTRA